MLFVDDCQAQVGIFNIILDQGVGPNDQIDVPPLDGIPQLTVLFGRQRTGQQANVNGGSGKGFCQFFSMLSRKDFGGRHQSRLVPCRDGGVDSNSRHNRLPGTNIPLEEAVHLVRTAQVSTDLVDHPLLGIGQLKADLGDELLDLIVMVEDPQTILLPLGLANCLEPQLKEEELLVGSGPPGGLNLGSIGREVEFLDHLPPVQEAVALPQ